jgi:Ser/Thr protein kinase RdoA (MazF antagonist)
VADGGRAPAATGEDAARAALAAWQRRLGDGSPRLSPLAGGSEGVPWRVDAAAGRFVLRRYDGNAEQAAERATAALAAAGAAFRARGLGPRPVPADDGGAFVVAADAVWTLETWLAGRPRRRWERLSPAQAAALGAALGQLHAALRALPPDLAGASATASVIPRRGQPDDQVLHGDPSQGNVLWRTRAGAPAIAFVDFDRVSRGAVELDVARALLGFAPWAAAGPPAAASALVAGYRAVGGAVRPQRLWRALDVALAEGETWLSQAHLEGAARRRAERWLTRARSVGSDAATRSVLARAAARPPRS